MEKRRIRLEINGVVCGFLTEETDEYMEALAEEVGGLMKQVLDASPFITREAAALTAAMSYCDDARKNGEKLVQLQDRVDELEVEAELWQEEKAGAEAAPAPAGEDPALKERLRQLEERNTVLEEAAARLSELESRAQRLEDENAALREAAREAPAAPAEPEAPKAAEAPRPGKRRNPLRYEDELEQEGFVSFFARK